MHLLNSLLTSLASETMPANIKTCLNLLQIFVVEDAFDCKGLPNLVIKTIQEKILTGLWPPIVIFAAYETLNNFILFSDILLRDNKNCPRELIIALCRHIEGLFADDNIVVLLF